MISNNIFLYTIGLLYLLWAIFSYNVFYLKKKRIDISLSGFNFFDALIKSALLALIFGRAIWLVTNMSHVQEVGFWFFPYIKTGDNIMWFSYYPWRFFLFSEGVNLLIAKIIFLILIILKLLLPLVGGIVKYMEEVGNKKQVFKMSLLLLLGSVVLVFYLVKVIPN